MIDGFEHEDKRRLDASIDRLGILVATIGQAIEHFGHAVERLEAGDQPHRAGAQYLDRLKSGAPDEHIELALGLFEERRQRQRPVFDFDDTEIFMLRAQLAQSRIGKADTQILRCVLNAERQIHGVGHLAEKAQHVALRQVGD